jgi:hypothetical protein
MATKSRGIGRGGPRPGGGRPKGSRNKRTVLAELLPKLAEEDQQLPLYRLLDRIADKNLDDRYRDMLCIATLPFLHARPRSDLTAKAPFQMSDAELIQVREAEEEHQRQLKRGKPELQVIRGRQ